MPACVSTPEAAPLHMYVLHTNTYTRYMHTHIVESPDICFHRHQADSGILNPNNAFCWFYSEACENGGCDGRESTSAWLKLLQVSRALFPILWSPLTTLMRILTGWSLALPLWVRPMLSSHSLVHFTMQSSFILQCPTDLWKIISCEFFFFLWWFFLPGKSSILAFLKDPRFLSVVYLSLPDPGVFITSMLSFQEYGEAPSDIWDLHLLWEAL